MPQRTSSACMSVPNLKIGNWICKFQQFCQVVCDSRKRFAQSECHFVLRSQMDKIALTFRFITNNSVTVSYLSESPC